MFAVAERPLTRCHVTTKIALSPCSGSDSGLGSGLGSGAFGSNGCNVLPSGKSRATIHKYSFVLFTISTECSLDAKVGLSYVILEVLSLLLYSEKLSVFTPSI